MRPGPIQASLQALQLNGMAQPSVDTVNLRDGFSVVSVAGGVATVDVSGIAETITGPAATKGDPLQPSNLLTLTAHGWDGAASVATTTTLQAVAASSDPDPVTGYTSIAHDGMESIRVYPGGALATSGHPLALSSIDDQIFISATPGSVDTTAISFSTGTAYTTGKLIYSFDTVTGSVGFLYGGRIDSYTHSFRQQNVPASPTPNWDPALGESITATLTAATSPTIPDGVMGQLLKIRALNSGGSYAITFPANVTLSGGTYTPSADGKWDAFVFEWDFYLTEWRELSRALNQ